MIPRLARECADHDGFSASAIPICHEAVIGVRRAITAGLALAAR
jgi:hypothetical protein